MSGRLVKFIASFSIIFSMFCFLANAEYREPIRSVHVVSVVNGVMSSETASINIDTPHCIIENYEIRPSNNTIVAYLKADDGYYFGFKNASDVKLDGSGYVTARKESSSAILRLVISPAVNGEWVQDDSGWYYVKPDGSKPCNGWFYIEKYTEERQLAKGYYFDENGYMLTNCQTPDGKRVNENGEYTNVITRPSDEYENGYVSE